MKPESDIKGTPWERDSGYSSSYSEELKKAYTRFPLFLIMALCSFPVIVILGYNKGQASGVHTYGFVPSSWAISIKYIISATLVTFSLAVVSEVRKERIYQLRNFLLVVIGLPLIVLLCIGAYYWAIKS